MNDRAALRTTTLVSTFVLSLSACVAGVFAQPASGWRAQAEKVDAIYVQALEKAAEERRADNDRAGEIWRKAMEAEVAEALRADDTTLARGLRSKLDALAEAGLVPLARPDERLTYNRHEYAFIGEPKTWDEARKHCERLGGRLLVLDTPGEERFILGRFSEKEFWIGVTDLHSPGVYQSLDGKPFRGFGANYRYDNNNNRQNCVGWWATDKNWDDFDDGKRMAFICEWE